MHFHFVAFKKEKKTPALLIITKKETQQGKQEETWKAVEEEKCSAYGGVN